MNEQRPLGTFSDEIDRVVRHMDRRFDETHTRIDGLTEQVKTTNGRVRTLELAQAKWEGMKAGAGGSWVIVIGVVGMLLGGSTLALSIVLGLTR